MRAHNSYKYIYVYIETHADASIVKKYKDGYTDYIYIRLLRKFYKSSSHYIGIRNINHNSLSVVFFLTQLKLGVNSINRECVCLFCVWVYVEESDKD